MTAKTLRLLDRTEQLGKLSDLCLHNTKALLVALQAVNSMGIGAFRVLSPLFPRFTHPEVGYALDDLPGAVLIKRTLTEIRNYRRRHDIRLSFHPDQFVVLSSPHAKVVENARKELEYQGMIAEMIAADVINIHGGGQYGDKQAALRRFEEAFRFLSPRVQARLTLENDDIGYTVSDLLPVCEKLQLPLVYDVHHHRCKPDGLSVEEATRLAIASWVAVGREPYFHISSPKYGWKSGNLKAHADYIDPVDFPECWRKLTVTVDVEAKAKELAVQRLMEELGMKI